MPPSRRVIQSRRVVNDRFSQPSSAGPDDVAAVHRLIAENTEVGHLLPRSVADVERTCGPLRRRGKRRGGGRLRGAGAAQRRRGGSAIARRRRTRIAASASAAAWSTRSPSVAGARGFATLCAFTHEPSHFVRMGFTIVPHIWVPEKIAHDCTSCALFRRCGQYAVTLPLARRRHGQAGTAGSGHPRIARGRIAPADGRATALQASGGAAARTGRGRAGVTTFDARPIEGGITAARGFRAAGVACGIKATGAPDLALVAADGPVSAAAVFTTNLAQAAPVVVSREHLGKSGGRAAAIVVNSGCANACTGPDGLAHANAMARLTRSRDRVRSRGRARRVDRRDRREARYGEGRARHRERRAASVASGGLGRGARDHDDRSVPEGSGRRGDRRRW